MMDSVFTKSSLNATTASVSPERAAAIDPYQPLRTSSNYLSSSLGGNLGTDMTKLLATSSTSGTTSTSTSTSTTTTTTALCNPANAVSGQSGIVLRQLMDDMRQIEDTVDSIEIPARGRCKVFMAKYGYDPFKQSPNEDPGEELPFDAGDYIMVFDDLDQDGYFIGELMDGRRGYVPSNWLDRLTGEDLFDFQANVLYKQPSGAAAGKHQGASDAMAIGASNLAGSHLGFVGTGIQQQGLFNELADDVLGGDAQSFPPELYDAIVQDSMNHSNYQHLLAPEDYHRMNDYVDLDDVNEVDDECLSDYERAEAEQMRRAVPPPQRLILERQLNKCILIAWLHPPAAKGTIVSYQVYVDGVLKSTVPSGDRTKALLEGVDSSIPHRISVRAIDLHGRCSNDAGCTIVIGTRVPFAPSCVKASHITSDSALISWLPCNSNFHHVVAVNSVEVQTVRPGVYKHLINGLSANTLYRVWVRAKPGKILSIDEKNPKKLESLTTYVDFKTMPKSLPDPPVNVQVEAGPQRRTLLVTWLPLTLNDYGGSSNGCPVTGYAVFAGHKKLADIDSPTGDHALLDLADLESLHKKSVTVRTKSGENLSQDSMPCQIPDEYLKSALSAPAAAPSKHSDHHHHHHHQYQQQHQQPPHYQQTASKGHHHHHRLSTESTTGSHSPSGRHQRAVNASGGLQRQQQQQQQAGLGARHRSSGRSLVSRSLQNLDSDLDSRRSSLLPAIEVTRDTSAAGDLMRGAQNSRHLHNESYSEEEFENSMRFRGPRAGGKGAAARGSHPRQHSPRYLRGQNQQLPPAEGRQSLARLQQPRATSATPASAAPLAAGEVRYFVALFDYDPLTMSPNPNAAADELTFKEGSIIKVYGPLGEDGFYKGELDNNQVGYVPCNVILEITDPNLLQSLYASEGQAAALAAKPMANSQGAFSQQQPTLNQQQVVVGAPSNQAGNFANQASIEQLQQQQSQGGVKRMVALYDYDPQENSPNADTESEIPFKTGDIIYVYGKMDTDGFYMGEVERTKQRGLVPSNFLREDPQATAARSTGAQAPYGVAGAQATNALGQQQNAFLINQQHQQMAMGNQGAPNMQGAFGGAQQNQAAANQQQMRGSQMRVGPNSAMGGLQQQQQQQNINRPNTLSLRAQQVAGIQGPRQQQHPAQMQAGQVVNNMQQQQSALQMAQAQQGNIPTNFMSMQQRNANPVMGNPGANMMGAQQPQQQPSGGVLSNLLSSGKQIIGATSTPRAANPMGGNQFPGGQMGGGVQQQQPMQMQMPMPMPNQQAGGLGGGDNFSRLGGGQQMLGQGANQLGNFNQMNSDLGSSLALQQVQQQQQLMQNQMGNFGGAPRGPSMGIGLGGGMNTHSLMGGAGSANNPGQHLGPGADDQGGNILNTVKNMFKL